MKKKSNVQNTSSTVNSPSFFEVLDAVSHDLKSPVASIMSVLSLVKIKKEKLTGAELEDYLVRAEQKSQFLNENLDALFAVGALLESKVILQNQEISLVEVFQQIQFSLSKITLPEITENLTVQGDPEWLPKSLVSILQHVQRFASDASTVKISVSKNSKDAAAEIEITYEGEALISEEKIDLTTFLPLITKERRLSLFVAIEMLRKQGGVVKFNTTGNSQVQTIQISM